MKALVIVAHPDDESLFMGGTMAEFRKWQWMVLCVTDCDRRYNKQRRQELLKACRIYDRAESDVKPFMLGLRKQKGRFFKKEIKKKIEDFIDEFGPFDITFTHGEKGDYGHKTHRLIHGVVNELKIRNLYNFSLSALKNTYKVNLSPLSRRIKKKSLNIYLKGSQETNLSRLKRIVNYAVNTTSELFISVN